MAGFFKTLVFAAVLLFGIGYGNPVTGSLETGALEKRASAAAAGAAAGGKFAAASLDAVKASHAAKFDTFEAAKAKALFAGGAAAKRAGAVAAPIGPFFGRLGYFGPFY